MRDTIADVIDWLAGTWSIERSIEPERGTFVGVAHIAVEGPDAARWEDRGRLVCGALDGPAWRVLRLRGSGPSCHVLFDDGRPFHPLHLSTGACAVEHLCGDDTYRGEYVVHDDTLLGVTWRVDGPRKSYVVRSRYTREASAGPLRLNQ